MVGGDLASGCAHAAGEVRVAQHHRYSLRDLIRMSGHEAGAAIVQDLTVATALGSYHWPTSRGSFQWHHPEWFALRSIHADRRPRVDLAQRLLIDASAEHYSPVETETARQSTQVLLLRSFADDPENTIRSLRQGLDYQIDALVLPEITDEQQRV